MMTTRMFLSLGLSALVLGGLTAGCSVHRGGLATGGAPEAAVAAKLAMKQADAASKALVRHDAARAIGLAEAAVGLNPRHAAYRVLLGRAYMEGGRFGSARTAFADALSLAPGDGKAALNLALAQIATGDADGARATLSANAATILPADHGLALALTGDPVNAVAMLSQAARTTGATPKIRQNLALSLALAGQWSAARAVAAVDLSPADLDRRMEEWAAFAQPRAASDQVAALLGVTPAVDPGQPVALALNAVVAPVAVAVTAVATPPAPVAEPVAQPPLASRIVFAEPREVAQPLPSFVASPATGPVKPLAPRVAIAPAQRAQMQAGDWYVQFGAFETAALARQGWSRAVRLMPAFADRQPTGMTFRSGGGTLYRVSVGGFDQNRAAMLCRHYRAKGGNCFVRRGAGDRVAEWLSRPLVRVAAR